MLLACKTVPVVPSLLNILQTKTAEPPLSTAGHSAWTRRVGDTDPEQPRQILKIENKNGLTYKNLNRNMIHNLRRIYRAPSSSEFGIDVRQTSPGLSTPCKFLSSYRSIGRCTEVRSCRIGDIEYLNNVRQTEDFPDNC